MSPKNARITPRLNFSSSLFTGASFHVSNKEVIAAMAAHPTVSAIWPVTVHPCPSPRIDSIIDTSDFHMMNTHKLLTKDIYTPHTMTGVDKLHALGYNGYGVKIAIIDTGIDYK